jgi:hypothetical protein
LVYGAAAVLGLKEDLDRRLERNEMSDVAQWLSILVYGGRKRTEM